METHRLFINALLLAVEPRVPVQTEVETFPLAKANEAYSGCAMACCEAPQS